MIWPFERRTWAIWCGKGGLKSLLRTQATPERALGSSEKEFMLKHLDGFLEHPRDRELFDLTPKENTDGNPD